MSSKEKYLNILNDYFPFEAIPDEEEQKLLETGGISSAHIKGAFYEPLFKEWLSWALENDQMSDSIGELRGKLDKRAKEDQEELIGHVLAVCFLAKNNKKFSHNTPDRIRAQNIETKGQLQSIVNNIEKLQDSINSISNGKTFKNIAPYINDGNLNKEECEIVSQFLAPNNPPVLSFDKLNDLIGIYQKLLKSDLNWLNKKPSYAYLETGPLKYPKELTSGQQLPDPELNGLIFNLALLFRQYTDTSNDGHWLRTKSGPMLKEGKPCHGLNASFINATFFNVDEPETGKRSAPRTKSGEFDENSITQRLLSLTRNSVEFTSW